MRISLKCEKVRSVGENGSGESVIKKKMKWLEEVGRNDTIVLMVDNYG